MKKYLSIIIIAVLLMSACSNKNKKDDIGVINDLGYEELSKQKNLIKEVSLDQLKEKMNNKEDFYLLIGRVSCPPCHQALPEYAKLSLKYSDTQFVYWSFEDVYQSIVDSKGVYDEETTKIMEYLDKTITFDGTTPLVFNIEKGKVISNTNKYYEDKSYGSFHAIFKDYIKGKE